MSDAYTVEDYLSRLSEGEAHLLQSALAIIADSILYVPVARTADHDDVQETKSIWVVSEKSGDRSAVPVFSSEEHLMAYSAGRYQCFPVTGAELALSLPCDRWMIINFTRPEALELSPDQVFELAACVSTGADESESGALLLDGSGDAVPNDPNSLTELSDFAAKAQAAEILRRFRQVKAGYYLRAQSGSETVAYMGLACERMESEQRFMMIAELAELSRRMFGFAGAIEVLDDLGAPSSASWDYFSAVMPFYVREGIEHEAPNEDYSHPSPLSRYVETVASAAPPWTPFSALRAGRDRFLRALRGRRINGSPGGMPEV